MYRFYVSSYAKGKEKGLYVCTLDETKNELHLNKHIPTEDFPSYVIKKDDYLYVSLKDARVGEGGGVASYHIEEDDLKQLSFYNSHGRSYTHLCLSPDQKYLFTANYHVGATAAFPLKDHKIGDKLSVVHHHGSGIDLLKRQTSPHAHYVGITPDHKYLYSVDLGADKIVMYEFINEKLQETSLSQSVIPGSGPRHMIFSHDGKYCYLVNEISNSIMVYQYHDGHFTLIQVIHCVPRHFHGFSSAAAIHMTSSGKHIIVSNRGHDSIVLYRVNQETGKITLLYMVHTGKGPRDFNIIDDRYIVVASQEEDFLELYTFDATPHLLRHRKTVHHHIRRLTQPFPFNRAVSRFAAEQHGAIGDRNVSRSQYIPTTVRNIPPDIVQSGIPVLPLAAAQQAHLLLGLQDNPPNRVDIRYRRFAEKNLCAPIHFFR